MQAGMSEMPLEPDSPDDESHSSETWTTDGGSHLELMFDRALWSAADVHLVRERCGLATDISCALFDWPPLEIGGLFCGDARIRNLNASFRGKDSPTNVLSFPSGEEEPRDGESFPAGEIAMAFETIRDEAARDGKSFSDHMTHLWVHALLHLMGHDHEDEDEAAQMEAEEVRVLARLGIADPYQETVTVTLHAGGQD